MDFCDALKQWSAMGHTTSRKTEEDGTYTVFFLKDGVQVGYFKAVPGFGSYWEYPDELIKTTEETELTAEDCWDGDDSYCE
jgi:hypothetical protein